MKSVKFCNWLLVVIVCSSLVSAPCGAEPPTLDDLWAGNAQMTFETTGVGENIVFHFPSMIVQGSQIWAYYITGDGYNYGVGRAVSSDGLNWTADSVPALMSGDKDRWSYPAITSLSHLIGREDGDGWSANVAQDSVGYLCYGPYDYYPSGPFHVHFYMMIDNNTADNNVVVRLTVNDYDGGQVLATRDVTRREFTSTYNYQKFDLNLTAPSSGHRLEFRTYWYDRAYIKEWRASVCDGNSPFYDTDCSSFPGVWKDGSTYYMAYEGMSDTSRIFLATSIDGISFYRTSNNIILSPGSLSWDAGGIGTPSLGKYDGIWNLYYGGVGPNPTSPLQIGAATGSSLSSLAKYPSPSTYAPIIPVGSSGAWDDIMTGKRSTILTTPSGYHYMAFEGQNDDPIQFSTGLARSTSTTSYVSWTKYPYNPIIDLAPSPDYGNDGPELLQWNGITYLYVRRPPSDEVGLSCRRYRLEWTHPTQRWSIELGTRNCTRMGLSVDQSNGNIYALNPNGASTGVINKYNKDGTMLYSFGPTVGSATVGDAVGMAVDPLTGYLYTALRTFDGTYTIPVVNATGSSASFVRWIAGNNIGFNNSSVDYLAELRFSDDGQKLYVAGYTNEEGVHGIYMLARNNNGTPNDYTDDTFAFDSTVIQDAGSLPQTPTSGVYGLSVDRNGMISVTDIGAYKKPVRRFTSTGNLDMEFYPVDRGTYTGYWSSACAADPYNNLWVAENIAAYDPVRAYTDGVESASFTPSMYYVQRMDYDRTNHRLLLWGLTYQSGAYHVYLESWNAN